MPLSGLVGQQTAAMLLYKRDNDNDAGFPRRDGRLPSLPEPTLRDALRDPRLYKYVSPGCKDGLSLILSAGFRNPLEIGLVGSRFHYFRWWAFALALQKLLLLVGLTTAVPFLGCFPEFIWQLPVLAWLSSALLFPWNFRCPLAVSCEALFPLLSCFRYICLNLELRKVTTFSAIFARWHKNRTKKVASDDVSTRATDILRESSALRATHRPVFRVFPLKRGGTSKTGDRIPF